MYKYTLSKKREQTLFNCISAPVFLAIFNVFFENCLNTKQYRSHGNRFLTVCFYRIKTASHVISENQESHTLSSFERSNRIQIRFVNFHQKYIRL